MSALLHETGQAGATTNLTSSQWLVCAAVGSTILWAGELVKTVLRSRTRRTRARAMQPQPSRTP